MFHQPSNFGIIPAQSAQGAQAKQKQAFTLGGFMELGG